MSNQHSTLSVGQVQAGLLAAAVEMRNQGLPKTADLVEDCVRGLVEQLEAAQRERQDVIETAASAYDIVVEERDELKEQLEAAHRNMDRYGMALAEISETPVEESARNGWTRDMQRIAREALNPAKRPRRHRLGWDVWGNEVESDVELMA